VQTTPRIPALASGCASSGDSAQSPRAPGTTDRSHTRHAPPHQVNTHQSAGAGAAAEEEEEKEEEKEAERGRLAVINAGLSAPGDHAGRRHPTTPTPPRAAGTPPVPLPGGRASTLACDRAPTSPKHRAPATRPTEQRTPLSCRHLLPLTPGAATVRRWSGATTAGGGGNTHVPMP
jgi:hypothetical protein